MIRMLYHGTNKYFEQPNLDMAGDFKDFGRGFYLTTNVNQAKKQAIRKLNNNDKHQVGFIYEYEFELDNIGDLRVLRLLECNKEWLDFIAYFRVNKEERIDFDLIYDRMADGQGRELPDILNDYRRGKKGFEETIKLIKWEQQDRDQYCFKTPLALQKIKRKRWAEVHKVNNNPRIIKWNSLGEGK